MRDARRDAAGQGGFGLSHLNCADMPEEDAYTRAQIALYDQKGARSSPPRCLIRSSAIRPIRPPSSASPKRSSTCAVWGWGFTASGSGTTTPCVPSRRSKPASCKSNACLRAMRYGRAGKLTRPTTTATIPIGYADGLNRHLGCGRWSVLVAGQPAPIVGRVCMDSCMIDITDIPGVKEGDEVSVFSPVPATTSKRWPACSIRFRMKS